MNYMLLLYAAEDAGPQPGSPEQAAQMQEWFAYSAALEKSGALVAGEPLQGSETATTVRVRNGDTVLTDGPFAETKEVLGGFYMIDVDDLDAALDWAARIPLAPYGSVEVRPLMELPPR
ncbi:MAG: YciI family protein [Acidimicrobiia bacterium]|nr:YciI family protein [Acidimicrobiia bacterium]